MKILYYSPHPNLNLASPSGPGTHMREVIEAFENEGHVVVKLIAGGETLSTLEKIKFDNPWYKRLLKFVLPELMWQTFKDIDLMRFDNEIGRKVQAVIETEKPDFIYERGYYLMTSGVKAAKWFSIPHIIELNAPYPEEKITFEGKSFFVKRANRREHLQVSQADAVVVVSSALKEYLFRKYPRSISKILVTPNAINPEKAKADVNVVEALRSRLNLNSDRRVIGFVGSIFRYHGVDILLQAFRELRMDEGRSNIDLLIVGDGIVLPELKSYAAQNGLKDHVHFVGNISHDQVYNYISLMDVAVMASSNWYGSPVKVFEYGAMRKAIIAPNKIPLHDVMVNGEDGILVSNEVSELLVALKKMLDNDSYRQRLAESFYHKVLNNYTWQHVANTILSKANEVIAAREKARALFPKWDKRLLALRTDFAHHGEHSGYKQILRYVQAAFVLGLTEGDEELVSKSKIRYQWLFEFDSWKFRKRIDIIHIMYAEDYLRFSPFLFRKIPVVATFHQPPETLEIEITSGKTRGQVGQITHWFTRSRFRRLAAAIVTEDNQKKILSRVMPEKNIHVIPLGVHLERFHDVYRQMTLEGENIDDNSIITVGNWLRDWKFYIAVVKHCAEHKPHWKFQLVNRKLDAGLKSEIDNLNNVKHHTDISDFQLKKMLFKTKVHFLPVISASGNNALMEGLAMGCPAVMTDVVSDQFPLRGASVLLHAKNNMEDAVQKMESIISLNASGFSQLKQNTFNVSLDYDWKEIAHRTLEVYNSVL